jgi:hypothetical protein
VKQCGGGVAAGSGSCISSSCCRMARLSPRPVLPKETALSDLVFLGAKFRTFSPDALGNLFGLS